MADRPVLLFDAHREGFKHSLVNAALAHAAEVGFPQGPVVWLADPGHRRWVEEALESGPAGAGERLRWQGLPGLPGRSLLARLGSRGRAVADLATYAGAARRARRTGARLLLVTSVTTLGVAALGRVARLCPGTPVLAVVHQVNDVLPREGGGRSRRGRRLLDALRRPLPPNLRFLATTQAIVDGLAEDLPHLASRFLAFDLPYFWHCHEAPSPPRPGEPVRFGFFGTARGDSFAAFAGLAGRVRREEPRGEFLLVGFLRGDEDAAVPGAEAVEGVGRRPLSLPELRRRAQRVHYALWTRPPAEYRLRLSASVLDALSHVRPLVAVRSPFVEHCFRTLGDVGYLCGDEAEAEAVVRALLREPPVERYQAQCATILRQRGRFDPTTAGATLARLAGEMGSAP